MINVTTRVGAQRARIEFERRMIPLENLWAGIMKAILDKQYMATANTIRRGVFNINFPVNNETTRMTKSFLRQYRRVETTFGDWAFGLLASKGIKEDVPTERKEGIRDKFWAELKDWNRFKAAEEVTKVQATTKRKLGKIIQKGMSEGLSHRDIADNIAKIRAIGTANRAILIARTETHTAAVHSFHTAVRSTGFRTRRTWTSSFDKRTRPEHRKANNQKRIDDEPFKVWGELLMYPGDSSLGASAKNVGNCRCVEQYNVVREAVRPVAVRPLIPEFVTPRVTVPRLKPKPVAKPEPSVSWVPPLTQAESIQRLKKTFQQIRLPHRAALKTAAQKAKLLEITNAIEHEIWALKRKKNWVMLAEKERIGTLRIRSPIKYTQEETSLGTTTFFSVKKRAELFINFDNAEVIKGLDLIDFGIAKTMRQVVGGNSLNGAIRHEMGHMALFRSRTLVKEPYTQWGNQFKKIKESAKLRFASRNKISDYALVDKDEFFAECVVIKSDPGFVSGSLDKALGIKIEGLIDDVLNVKAGKGVSLAPLPRRIVPLITEPIKPGVLEKFKLKPSAETKKKILEKKDTFIESAAKKRGMTKEEYISKADGHLKKLVDESGTYIRMRERGVQRFVKEGEYKTFLRLQKEQKVIIGEPGTGGLSSRLRTEKILFGLPEKEWALERRPIYSYLTSKEGFKNELRTLDDFGEVKVKLKMDVRKRSTMIFGDSFYSADEVVISPVKTPAINSIPNQGISRDVLSRNSVDFVEATTERDFPGKISSMMGYSEQHIFGGVKLKDVEQIIFPKQPHLATQKILAEKNISWKVIRPWE